MPRKPTEPFGHIAFGKDGSVRKKMDILPSDKEGQERSVAQRFATVLAATTGGQYEVDLLEEADHDFVLKSQGSRVIVQATEIVSKDYLRPLTREDFVNGRHAYNEFVQEGPDRIFGVDQSEKENVILSKVKGKLAKHYAKPKAPFWLLIWTVRSEIMPFYWKGGQFVISTDVLRTRSFLLHEGSSPFDEVWYFYLDLRPHRIWPPQSPQVGARDFA